MRWQFGEFFSLKLTMKQGNHLIISTPLTRQPQSHHNPKEGLGRRWGSWSSKGKAKDGRAGGTESEPRRAQLSPRTFSLALSREAYWVPYPNCLLLTVYLASAESGCGPRESGSSDGMTTCSRVEGLPKMRPWVLSPAQSGRRDWRFAYKVKIEF